MPKKLTTKEFIEKAKLIHGDKYDYSLVEYNGNQNKVKIIFNDVIYLQKPNCHLSKRCPEKIMLKRTTIYYYTRI